MPHFGKSLELQASPDAAGRKKKEGKICQSCAVLAQTPSEGQRKWGEGLTEEVWGGGVHCIWAFLILISHPFQLVPAMHPYSSGHTTSTTTSGTF